MRIVFFGIPDMALVCLNRLVKAGKNIVAAVPPVPAHPSHNLMVNTSVKYGIPVIYFYESPNEADFVNAFKSFEPDLAVVCSFDHLFPQDVIDIPKLGMINCHPSLLPDYRGGNPYFHIINNNEKQTGITVHYMDGRFDTGDIIAQIKMDVSPDETMGTLFNRQNYEAANMVLGIVNRFEKEGRLDAVVQDKTSSYKKAPIIYPEKRENAIDWNKDAKAIERFVRACNPFFGATCFFRGHMLRLWSGKYSLDNNKNIPCGSIAIVRKEAMGIQTAEGMYFPKVLQLGSYLTTDIEDFIRRTSPQAGEKLSG
jgi:methionyl-tRNA formyltransferase